MHGGSHKEFFFLAVLQMQEFSYQKSYVFVLLHFVPILAL